MNAQFQNAISLVPELFQKLISSEPFREKGVAWQKGKAGIYAFFDGGKAIHVGRTRNLANRLRGHITTSHYSASFAFKQTRVALERVATYKPAGSRANLVKEEAFAAAFLANIARLKLLDIRFIEVTDPVIQYLLELYAHMELGLPLDEFSTH